MGHQGEMGRPITPKIGLEAMGPGPRPGPGRPIPILSVSSQKRAPHQWDSWYSVQATLLGHGDVCQCVAGGQFI